MYVVIAVVCFRQCPKISANTVVLLQVVQQCLKTEVFNE